MMIMVAIIQLFLYPCYSMVIDWLIDWLVDWLIDHEIDRWIAKAAGTMSKLNKRVWSNGLLSLKTKAQVYQACVLSTLLYSSEAWTTYAKQESRLEVFHLRCLRRILGVTWEDKVTNDTVLEKTGLLSIHPSPVSTSSTLARPCKTYAGWTNPQRCSLRGTCTWNQISRPTSFEIQRCMQTWPQSNWHWRSRLGSYCDWPGWMAPCCEGWREERRGGPTSAQRRKENSQKAKTTTT